MQASLNTISEVGSYRENREEEKDEVHVGVPMSSSSGTGSSFNMTGKALIGSDKPVAPDAAGKRKRHKKTKIVEMFVF